MEEKERMEYCQDCDKPVPVGTIETADKIITICKECDLELSKTKKNKETQQSVPENREGAEEKSTEKSVHVSVFIPGDFNTVYLVNNPKELKKYPGKEPFIKKAGQGLPAGTQEPGETAAEAAFREAKEETGFSVKILEETKHVEDRGDVLHVGYVGLIWHGEQKDICKRFPLDALPGTLYGSHRGMISILDEKWREIKRKQ